MCSVDWGTKSPLPPYCTNSWLFTHTQSMSFKPQLMDIFTHAYTYNTYVSPSPCCSTCTVAHGGYQYLDGGSLGSTHFFPLSITLAVSG
eukprot:jgi/Botrbrau1/11856/Bobra.0175s0018.1